jgi:hypothetical protein
MISAKSSACSEHIGAITEMISSGIVEKTGSFFQQVLKEKHIKISVKKYV